MKFLGKIIHLVVPHEKNKNIPHLLKVEFVAVLSLLVVTLFLVNQNNFYIIQKLNLAGAVYPAVLTDMTNHDREEVGVSKLAWNDSLENAAKLKVSDMIQNSYFAHTSPTGLTPWHWFKEVKYDFIYAGENLAIDFDESEDVEKAWLNSPSHRANVLNSNYTEIGIMAMNGTWEGRDTTFVVELFGKPQDKKTVQKVAATSPVKVLQKVDKNTEKFISVQNEDAKEEVREEVREEVLGIESTEPEALSTWYMRLAVNPTNTIKIIYGFILGLVLIAMTLVLSKEYKRHHTKHLVMGLLLAILTGVFLYFIKSTEIIYAF